MGIPRLTNLLRPYFVPTVLGCNDHKCLTHPIEPNLWVIDGPALVYAVYYRLLACKPISLNALDAQPSYTEIGDATLSFLDQLCKHGIQIEKIYFDGYLPPQKRTVRVSRLESYLKQIIACHANNKEFKIAAHGAEVSRPEVKSLFDFLKPVPVNFRGLPAVPFLVPAALETLTSSVYSDVLEIVPEEADSFCARAARRCDGLVLTGDSDLLIHDLGSDGGVVFMDQLELRECEEPNHYCLTATVAKPREIAKRLAVDSLLRLAFEIKEDSTVTLQEAVRRSKLAPSSLSWQLSYSEFCQDYANGHGQLDKIDLDSLITRTRSTPLFDPRLSELALQCDFSGQQPLHIYLPFLIEDPTRAPAWEVSAKLRYLAYSLLSRERLLKHKYVLEYRRRDVRIVPTGISITECLDQIVFAEMLYRKTATIESRFGIRFPSLVWRVLGMIEVLSWYVDSARTLPSHKALLKVFCGEEENSISWQDVQLCAQLQSAFYSIRILKQVLDRLVHKGATGLGPEMLELHSKLVTLPLIQELVLSRQELPQLTTLGLELDELFGFIIGSAQPE